MTAPIGFSNPERYASGIGGCCAGINREHSVSECVLELVYERFGAVSKFVPVQNLAFRKRELLQRLGVSNLTLKILCATHNRLLSPFDPVGKAMFMAMDALNEAATDPARTPGTVKVDGDALERWMPKTLYGGLFSGNFPPPEGASYNGVHPPAALSAMF